VKRILTLCLPLILAAGCSGLQATSAVSDTIDSDAILMTARIASTQPATDLAANATEFKAFYDAATVNVFSYLFGDKTILCTATLYYDLQYKAVLSEVFSEAAAIDASDISRLKKRLTSEAAWMNEIYNEKEGK
jgi:hypothetical protein